MNIAEPARALTQIVIGRGYFQLMGHLRRDPLAQLIATGRPAAQYAVYERIRAAGPLAKSPSGAVLAVDHAVSHETLRNRHFVADLPNLPFRAVDLSLLSTDPPDHTRLRRLVAPAFTPGRIRRQEEVIRRAVDELLDQLTGRLADGPVDLIEAYAKPLPILVIASLLGLPETDVPMLARHGDAIAGVLDGLQSMRHYRAVVAARQAFHALFLRAHEQRSATPGLINDLAEALDRGELTTAEYLALCQVVLLAGFETTINLIGNAVSALPARPATWRRLVADPALVDRALEETLRWESPVQAVARATSTEVQLAGQLLPPNQLVVVFLAAANRDPQVFDRPAEFDIDRPNAVDHLAFGHGIHHCLGRPLAMLESRIALTELVNRLPGLRLAGQPTDRPGFTLRGRAVLPVRV